MTPLSLNTRASAPFRHALSDHSCSTLQPLLRSIAMWHRGRTRLVPIDPDPEFDDIEIEDAPEPDAPAHGELERVLNEDYSSTPAASTMSPAEIEKALSANRDPWAEAVGKGAVTSLPAPPIATMIVAARFAAMLTCPGLQQEITAPRAFTLIAIEDSAEREAVWKDINNVLNRLADLCAYSDDTWRGFATPSLHGSTRNNSSEQRSFDALVAAAVREGQKLIALTNDTQSMSPVTRAMCQNVFELPPLSGQMIIEILRVTHTATGELSEDTLLNLLPSDTKIAALPQEVIEGAFLNETTLQVAKALAAASARLQQLPPAATTLNDIVLNANTCAPVGRLTADMNAWKAGHLDWSEVPSSALLHGPPGNGKTLLASAIAGSLNIPLIATSYSDCQKHGHQGDMLKALSGKVDEAVRSAPCVFFLDEIDSFTHRNRPSRRSDYIVGVVNGLLEHLSRLNNTAGVIVLGATNYPDMIDPAVIRPGRFDLKIELSNPDRSSIRQILELALSNDAKNQSLSPITDQLLGASGAQVTALVREARGLARAEQTTLKQCHLAAAAAQICPAMDQELLWRVASHEAGHIVVGHVLGLPEVQNATITSSGGFVSRADIPLHTIDTALNKIAVLLAGHAAESIILGGASNGSGLGVNSDFSRATVLAARTVFEWGLGEPLTHIAYGSEFHLKPGDDSERHVDDILQKQLSRAAQIIEDHRPLLDRVAKALIKHRELGQGEITALLCPIDDYRTPPATVMPDDNGA